MGETDRNAMITAKFSFPLNRSLLNEVMAAVGVEDEDPDVIGGFILFSYLGWELEGNGVLTDNPTDVLLTLLTRLCKPTIPEKIRRLAFECFYDLFMSNLKFSYKDGEFSKFLVIYENVMTTLKSPYMENYPAIMQKITGIYLDTPEHCESIDGRKALSVISSVLLFLRESFPLKIVEEMLPVICCSMNELNVYIWTVIATIAGSHGLDVVEPFLSILMLSIVRRLESEKPLNPPYEAPKGNKVVLEDQSDYKFTKKMVYYETIKPTFETERKRLFPQKIPIESLVREDIRKSLDELVGCFASEPALTKHTVGMMAQYLTEPLGSEYTYDIMAAFLYMMKEFRKKVRFPPPADLATNKLLFNPSGTIFQPPPNWPIVNTLRSCVFDLATASGIGPVRMTTDKFTRVPYLFAEAIYRIIPRKELTVRPADIKEIVVLLFKPMCYYQAQRNLSEEQLEAVCVAREALFIWMNGLFKMEANLYTVLNDGFFTEMFLSMLFEPVVKPFVMDALIRYLNTCEDMFSPDLVNKLLDFFDAASEEFGKEDYLKLVKEVLDAIIESFARNDKRAPAFEPAITIITHRLFRLPVSSLTIEFLSSFLTFLIYTAKYHSMGQIDISAMTEIVQRLWGDNPPRSLYTQIVQWAAGSTRATPEKPFTLCQPKALAVLFTAFRNSELLEEIVNVVRCLCEFNETNCQLIHDSEIDIALLSIAKNQWDGTVVKNEIIENSLDLFMNISKSISSVSAVQHFISLLCPIDGKKLPIFHMTTLKTLSSLLSYESNKKVAIPFMNCMFGIRGMQGEMLDNGFTVFLNLSRGQMMPNDRISLFKAADSKKQRFALILTWNALIIEYTLGDGPKQIEQQIFIPSNEWSYLACVFAPAEATNTCNVTVFMNDEKPQEFSIEKIKLTGRLRVRVGDGMPSDSIIETPTSFNTLGLFQVLPDAELRSLCKGEISQEMIQQALFYFVPEVSRQSIALQNMVLDSDIDCANVWMSSSNTSFADALIKLCGIDLLLPLFAQWSMPLINDEPCTKLPEITMEIFRTAILKKEEGQKSFYQKDGFVIMSYLLRQRTSEFLTYELYMSMFNIFNELVFAPLKEQAFTSVLVNPGLLEMVTRETRNDILEHWNNVLFPENMELALNKRPFGWLLCELKFFLGSLTLKQCSYESESKSLDLMVNLIVMMGNEKLTDDDGQNLVSSIIAGSVTEQMYLITVMRKLLQNPSILSELTVTKEKLPLLLFLQKSEDDGIAAAGMEIVVEAAKIGVFNEIRVDAVIDVVLHQMRSSECTNSRFLRFKDLLVDGMYDIFPICAWMAVNLGDSAVKLLYEGLIPGEYMITSQFWATWPVYTILKGTREEEKIIKFLVKCTQKDLNALLTTVEVVGKEISTGTYDLRRKVLWEYIRTVVAKPSQDEIITCFAHIRRFLFYHESGCDHRLSQVISESYIGHSTPTNHRDGHHLGLRQGPRLSITNLLQDDDNAYTPSKGDVTLSFLSPVKRSPRRSAQRTARRTSIRGLDLDDIPRFICDEADSPLSPTAVSAKRQLIFTADELDITPSDIIEWKPVKMFSINRDADGTWIDIDVARSAVKLYGMYKYEQLIPTVLTICSFLLYYEPDFAASMVSSITPETDTEELIDAIAFYNYHAMKTDNTPIRELTLEDLHIRHSNFLEHFETDDEKIENSRQLKFCEELANFQNNNKKFSTDSYEMLKPEVVDFSNNKSAEFEDVVRQEAAEAKSGWNHYLHLVTTNRAPWRNSLAQSSIREQHFTRDFTSCINFSCPKLKVNMKFNPHKNASYARDRGDFSGTSTEATTQDAQVGQTQKELQQRYTESNLGSLFELVEEDVKASVSTNISSTECILELPCEVIKVGSIREATFMLMSDMIVIAYTEQKAKVMMLSDVHAVQLRTRLHLPTAIEIFSHDGRTLFVNFPNFKATSVLKSFKRIDSSKYKFIINSSDFKSGFDSKKTTDAWIAGEMSNYEYLLRLNIASGRSFNDLSQYPVFPWILSDYTSEELDLADPTIYRDLSKPMGALTEDRLEEILDKREQLIDSDMYPYMYSSGYSCPLSVCLWLIRLEPFTTSHIDIQGGKFDHAARLFISVADAYRSATTIHNDFRELIPEFYSSPDFLINHDHFDLGEFMDKKIDDVELPPWAHKSAMEFVYLQRKALESQYVSENLQNWIDLIWGDKQQGDKAENAFNIFQEELYSDIWTPANLNDPKERSQIEAMLCHVGQIPPRLFDKPHPSRDVKKPTQPFPNRRQSSLPRGQDIVAVGISSTERHHVKIYVLTEDQNCESRDYNIPQIMTSATPTTRAATPRAKRSMSTSGSPIRPVITGRTRRNSGRESSLGNPGSILQLEEQIIYSFASDSFNIVSKRGREIVRIKPDDGGTKLLRLVHNSNITFIVSEGNWTLVGDRDSSFSIYKANTLKFTIPLFTSSVETAALSRRFRLAVCGTKDCSLIFSSLTNGYIVRIIDTASKPSMILVTSGWGFVCVYSTKLSKGQLLSFITLYDVNGTMIREQELPCGIAAWSTFTTKSGFDYIVMATDTGKCYLFEAFYLDIGAPFYEGDASIKAVHYSVDDGVAVVAFDLGKVGFFPVEYNHC